MGVRVRGPRVGRRQPGQLPARHLRGRPDPPRPADGAVPLAAARTRCPTSTSTWSPPGASRSTSAILDRFGGERCRLRLDDGHLPGAARDPRRRRRARHAAGRDRRDRQGVPAHPGPRRPRRRCASCPSCGPAGSATPRLDLLFRLVERLDGLPRHIALHPCGVLLSDATLLDRTPVEASFAGLPDEPVRQGRRRGPRPAQARRARHPDAVGDGARGRARSSGSTASTIDLDDEAQVPLRRPGDLPR